jgi:hypothetical protein
MLLWIISSMRAGDVQRVLYASLLFEINYACGDSPNVVYFINIFDDVIVAIEFRVLA